MRDTTMDAVTATYLKMRAGPPAPKLGVRMGFLTESASEQFAQFLHENFDEVSDSTFHLVAAFRASSPSWRGSGTCRWPR
jgi:hypothetical protein